MKTAGIRRLIAVVVTAAMLAGSHVDAFAVAETQKKLEEAKEQKKETENQKQQTEGHIDNMEAAQTTLKGELNSLNNQLTEVSDNLETLENNITTKNDEITVTLQELEEAKKTEEWQYICLKKRIQYNYEKSSHLYLDAVFSVSGLGEFLNLSEYFEQVAAYDQEMLAMLEQERKDVEAKEAQLEQEKKELEQLQADAEEEHKKFSGLITQTKGSITAYSIRLQMRRHRWLHWKPRLQSRIKILRLCRNSWKKKSESPSWRHSPHGEISRKLRSQKKTDTCWQI